MLEKMNETRHQEVLDSIKKGKTKSAVRYINTNSPIVLNITNIRISLGMSIGKLSQVSNVSRGYISELESGVYKNPSLSVICKLKVALKCRLDDLIITF